MGFMPCGLVVAALMLSAAQGNVTLGALGMALFGAATLPILSLAGAGARRLYQSHPRTARLASRGTLALNGALLCAIGLNLVSV